LKAAKHLTPQNDIRVVNSHHHNDHIRGNQVFPPDVDILSTEMTREGIIHREPETIKWEKENIPKALLNAKSKLRHEKDPGRRRTLALSRVYYEAILKSHPKLVTRLPNVTFEGSLAIRGLRRRVKLVTLAGHTDSDLVLILPDEKIAFMGDLLFVDYHPYLPGCSPELFKRSLGEVGKLGVRTLVPGHGPVGGPSDLSLLDRYMEILEGVAKEVTMTGMPLEDVSVQRLPKPFDGWDLFFEDLFAINLRFFIKYVGQKA
jgi:cyclase